MLIFDRIEIGKNLYARRKKIGLTQIEVAEKANLSDRTYADIERGSVNMRVDTLLKICEVLNIEPNDILVSDNTGALTSEKLLDSLSSLSDTDKNTAMKIIDIFINAQ